MIRQGRGFDPLIDQLYFCNFLQFLQFYQLSKHLVLEFCNLVVDVASLSSIMYINIIRLTLWGRGDAEFVALEYLLHESYRASREQSTPPTILNYEERASQHKPTELIELSEELVPNHRLFTASEPSLSHGLSD